jgi:hypothetical protein
MYLTIETVTENSESPAPTWALDHLAQLTAQKPGIEIELVELLFKGLYPDSSCNVKLKTLRAMHFISCHGSVAFRQACRREDQVIHAHLSKRPWPRFHSTVH